jgi:hypothetical protein
VTRRSFLSREEWPMIAAGIIVGILVATLVIFFFVEAIRGGGAAVEVRDRETGEIERIDAEAPPRRDGAGRGFIGRRERAIAERLERLRVDARPLRGPLAVTLRDLTWDDPSGTRFARAQVVRGQLNSAALQRGDVVLDNVVMQRPVVALRQAAPGREWNFEQVFAELLEGDGGPRRGPVRTIQVRNLQVLDGTVTVVRPGQRLAFNDLQARLPLVVLSQPGVPDPYLRVATLTTRFVQEDPQADLPLDIRDGLFEFPDGRVRFEVAAATLDETRLASISGVWNPADPGYGITAEGLALGVRFEDVRFALPEAFPETGTATFAWSVSPLAGDRTEATLTDLDATSGESRVLGSLTVRFGEEYFALMAADLRVDPLQLQLVEGFTGPLPYGGALVGRIQGTGGDITFDLRADLTAPTVSGRFAADLTGRVLLTDAGLALQRVDIGLTRVPLAALRAIAPGLPLEGVVTGTVSLSGPPDRAPLALEIRLEAGGGVAVINGTLDLTGPVPRYDLAGRLLGVDLQQVLAPDVPPVALTASFSFTGAGLEPATMDAALRVAGRFTGWEAAPGDTLNLVAAIRGGALAVESFGARLATADVNASGTWRFLEPQSGSLTYQAAVTSLAPWGPYLPLVGDPVAAGAVQLAGTLTGTLERLRLAGGLAAADIRAGGWQAASLEATYDVTTGGGALPVAVVDATAVGFGTPTLGDFTGAVLSLRMTPPAFNLSLGARRVDGGGVEVLATGSLPETGPREIVLQEARFDLEEGQWRLVQPATFRMIGDEIFIQGLAIEDEASDGRITVEGRILPWVNIDARIQAVALPTGDLQRIFGQPERVRGLLWADATVRGDPDNPLIDMEFRVDDGAINEVPLRRLEGRIGYVNRETVVDAVAMVDTAGRLDIRGRVPSVVRIGATPVFELIDGLPLEGSIRAQQFSLGALATFFPELRDATGAVNAEVTLAGTADAPVVGGAFTVVDGAATIVPLDQRYTGITADVAFDGRRLLLRDVRAQSDGWVVASGQVILERLDRPVVELQLEFDGFRPIGVENQRDAAVFGTLSIAGPPTELELTGDLEVDDGYVVIPQFGGPADILVDITRPPPVMGETIEPITDGGLLETLRIRNLRITAGEGAWFIAEEARAQLSGVLTINKIGNSTPIVGTLEGNRGQYTLIAGPIIRRFDIVAAQIRFLGAPRPNPSVDITARRIVFDPAGRELPVDVRITGTLESPRIALAGGEVVELAEAELLSLVLFGQPGFALSGDVVPGEALLEQTFLGGLAEIAAIELERSLGGLGLDIFQIRLGTGAFGGLGAPTVVMGRQLRPDVFLTVETGIAALLGGGEESPLGNWAVRLDWAFDPRSRLRLAWEPVYRGRGLRGAAFALPLTEGVRQQFLLEVRRRWTY